MFGSQPQLMDEAGDAGGSGGTGGGAAGGGSGNAGAGGGAPAGGAAAPWHGFTAPEDVAYVTNKGWTGVGDVVKSYRGAEKLIGKPADSLLTLPQEGDQAGWDAVYSRLGRPESPDKYDLMTGAPEGAQADPDVMKHIGGLFHAAGLNAKQASLIAKGYNEFVAQRAEQEMKDYNLNLQADRNTLQQEWGGGFDRMMGTAKMAARALDLPEAAINGIEAELGYANTMKLFAQIGQKLGEDKFVGGEGGGAARFDAQLTPQEAGAQISQMDLDPNVRAALTNRDHPAHKATVAKRSKLFSIAYPQG